MARAGDRSQAENAPGEFDSAFRDAVLKPWRASPRPGPGGVTSESEALRAELEALQQELDAAHRELTVERDARSAERQALQDRIAELEARPSAAPPALADLARGVDSLTDRMRSLADRRV